MKIVLIGFMGAGKSSVAKLLQQKTSWDIIDTDHFIEKKQGKSVAEIFATEGEKQFRQYETDALEELQNKDHVIIATGGGIVENERNHALLKHHAFVVYLQTTPEAILKFTATDQNRPLLQVEDPLAVIKERLQRREPIYQKLANLTIASHRQTLEETAQQICEVVKL